MMSLLPAALSSTMLLVDPAGPEACGGTALHVRLLGHDSVDMSCTRETQCKEIKQYVQRE